jgi:hypothetical protein
MPKCFKCEKEIGPAINCPNVLDTVKEVWDAPSGAVYFEGGHNFGSSLYDSLVDGVTVEILVCDECLQIAKGTDRMREGTAAPRNF